MIVFHSTFLTNSSTYWYFLIGDSVSQYFTYLYQYFVVLPQRILPFEVLISVIPSTVVARSTAAYYLKDSLYSVKGELILLTLINAAKSSIDQFIADDLGYREVKGN
jgi:hypothetical protein